MTKKIRKFFGLADYLEEEQFLQEQHRQGWKMTGFNVLGLNYIFEKCEPEEYIYQLDFKEKGQIDEEYLQLFRDCGWEYFFKYNGWFYFRKKKSEIEQENSIFNDAPSRAEMAKKITAFQCLVLFPILFLFLTTTHNLNTSNSIAAAIIMTVYVGLIVFFSATAIKTFFKLNKIIKDNTPIRKRRFF